MEPGDPANDDDDVVFLAEDSPTDPLVEEIAPEPWLVMIVDDDEDVHRITRTVIEDIRFRNRGLRIIDCNSGQAARQALETGAEVAVLLLDVVMESDDAGLQVVRFVRDTLGNNRTRIVLRTGQPGQAPEREVIVGYDINDYKTKTELTAQKLFTTLIAALRSYEDLLTLQASRDGLQRIGDNSTELFKIRRPGPFVERVLDDLIGFVSGLSGAVFCREPLQTAQTGNLRPLAMREWPPEQEAALLEMVQTISAERRNRYERGRTFLWMLTPGGRELIVYLAHAGLLDGVRRELLELFHDKIGIGYDNVVINEWLQQTNQWLEEEVRLRTRELLEKSNRLELANQKFSQELQLAAVLQRSILPSDLPATNNLRVVASMVPAQEVGGDFYNLLWLDEHRLAFMIADVSGKGVPAAFFMLRSHALLHEIASHYPSPARCLAEANQQLCAANPLELFVTLFFAVFDTRTRRLGYATAGHNMPVWLHADGSMETLPTAGGMLLGIFADAGFTESEVTLGPGDRLFLFTDGIVEAMNIGGDLFGQDRLESVLSTTQGKGVLATMDAVTSAVSRFAADCAPSDDITCLVLGVGRGAE